jgi:DNA-binding transcriptional ArsR family regulator
MFDPVPVFSALGCRTRHEIFSLLSEGPLCVGAIAKKLELTQPSVSQHLRILREAGLVTDQRCGYRVHYEINRETLAACGDHIVSMGRSRKGKFNCGKEKEPCAKRNANTPKN